MNKNDITEAVAEATDTSKADAAKAVDCVFETISGALKNGDGVQLIRRFETAEVQGWQSIERCGERLKFV